MSATATAIEVKERPILFSGPMVKAILEGRKTQTRRVVTGLPPGMTFVSAVPESNYQYGFTDFKTHVDKRCPYGRPQLPLEPPQDHLWVRETFVLQQQVNGDDPPFNDGRPIMRNNDVEAEWEWLQPHYRATDPTPELSCTGAPHKCDGREPCCHWQPSIFMPRWASRITLGVVNVRVERLQEITVDDIVAEGVAPISGKAYPGGRGIYVEAWIDGWDKLNAKRGYPWESNPFVWVIEFKKL